MITMNEEVEQRGWRRAGRRAPELAATSSGRYPPERLALMKRVSALLFLAGSMNATIGVLITQRTDFSKRVQAVCAVILAIIGITLLVARATHQRILAAVTLSIVIVAFIIAIARPAGIAPLFMLWPLVFAAYFFSRGAVRMLTALMVVGLATGIALNPGIELKVDTFIGVGSSVALMTWVVATMTAREERLRHELQHLASTDPLTGLLNRRAFDPCIDAMFAEAVATSSSVSIVMFDLDHFKVFNDRHGHLVGDDALRRVADVLRRQSRDGDAVSRFGGEEFVVALSGADVVAAGAYAERVAESLRSGDDERLRLSLSAGISTIEPNDVARDLVARADAALYVAKQSGRGRAAWFDGTQFAEQVFATE